MPSRNILKVDLPKAYYHVYARGSSKQQVFISEDDYAVFLNLLKRYLSPEVQHDSSGREYPHLRGKLELLAYCLMPNHFHLFVYQHGAGAMSALLRGVLTSYSRYFNIKYGRSGPVWESRYKASMILRDDYLQHISRYIHLNPRNWQSYSFSSIHSYNGERKEEWLQPERVLAQFDNDVKAYMDFVADYEDYKAVLDELKHELAEI